VIGVRRVLVAVLVLGLASCGSLTDLRVIAGRNGDPDAALEAGVRRLLAQPAIGFDYSATTSIDRFSVRMSGTVHPGTETWVGRGLLTTRDAGDSEEFEVRSIGEDRWLGLSKRPGAALCWFPMPDDRELEGLPAIEAGVPGFVTVLENLRAPRWQFGGEAWLTARLSLADAALLASTFELTTSELAPPDDSYGAVPLTVGIEDGVLHDLTMTGTEFVASFEQGGATLSEEASSDLRTRNMRLTFGGPTEQVRAPDPTRVYDGVHQRRGCPKPGSETEDA
jgi:hypothetical protein